jgi:hypothetical protein
VSTSAGTPIQVSISAFRTRSASAPGARSVARSAPWSAAPLVSARKISSTEASKLSDAAWSTRLRGPVPKLSRAAPMRLETPPCGTSTPLGCPVEPEV